MALRDTFTEELKTAMKAGDKGRLATIRLIQAALKDREIEARTSGKDLTEDDVLGLLQKMIKQRQESLRIYEEAKRDDLAAQERTEIEVISSFLPKQMDEAEVSAAIDAAVAETGAAGMKDMGKVMAALKAKFAGTMDFAKANGVVKELLTAG